MRFLLLPEPHTSGQQKRRKQPAEVLRVGRTGWETARKSAGVMSGILARNAAAWIQESLFRMSRYFYSC